MLLRSVLNVAALVAALLAPAGAAAETAAGQGGDVDLMADRRWRLVVSAPSFRLNAYPLGWQMNGEVGVEFLRFNMILGTVSTSPDSGIGGGIGYLYQHWFIERKVALQAGAFVGFWQVWRADDRWDGVFAFFVPTVRAIAGWRYVFVQLGFSAQIGDSVVPSFDIGLQIKV